MTDNNHDAKNTQKPKTPQTPFGGWASVPPKSQADDQPGAPQAVITNADGSQRPAHEQDLSTPKYEPKIKSFSDTFGVVNSFGQKQDIYGSEGEDEEESLAPQEQAITPPAGDTPADEPEIEEAPTLAQPAPDKDDPFAWAPEEIPGAASADEPYEPRPAAGEDEGWMHASTSYEELQSSALEALQAAQRGPVEEVVIEQVTPTVNPYTFNKGDEWTAPPMDVDTLAASDAQEDTPITDISQPERRIFEFSTPEQPQQESEPAEEELQALSPFNFTPYAEQESSPAPQGQAPETAPAADTVPQAVEPVAPINDGAMDAPSSTVAVSMDDLPSTTDAAATDMTLQSAQQLSTPAVTMPPMEQGETATMRTEAESASDAPSPRTSFQPYKPAAAVDTPPVPDSFTLRPEEASLLGEESPAGPQEEVGQQEENVAVTQDTLMDITAADDGQPASFASPSSDIQNEAQAETPFSPAPAPTFSYDAGSVAATDSDARASAFDEPYPATEPQPEETQAATPAEPAFTAPESTAFAPVEDAQPETYTPATAEESPLPEQSGEAWATPEEPLPEEQPFSAAEMPAPAQPEAAWQPQQPEATGDFGGGAGETAEGMFAAAQSDIPSPEQATYHEDTFQQGHMPADAPAMDASLPPSHSAEEVQSILQAHVQWLDSGGKNGRRANFRNANLHHYDLSGTRLSEASFRGANLTGANFHGSDMRGADMSEAQLYGANLSSVSLAGAILSRADLRQAAFDHADLQAVDFSGAYLTGAMLSGLNLSNAVLLDADLHGADLSHASLIGTNLRGANLAQANLTSANLSNANCRDVRFEQAILDGATLDGANLKNASVQGASLLGTDLSSAGDASPEQAIQAEREQLLQEWQRLKEHEAMVLQMQASIQQREMALQTDRVNTERARREIVAQYESVEKLISTAHEVMERHRVHDRHFKYFGVLWFMFTILMAVATMLFIGALELNELDWLELSIVFGGCALILGLFIATTVRSIKLSNNLKQLLDMYGQHVASTDKTGH